MLNITYLLHNKLRQASKCHKCTIVTYFPNKFTLTVLWSNTLLNTSIWSVSSRQAFIDSVSSMGNFALLASNIAKMTPMWIY